MLEKSRRLASASRSPAPAFSVASSRIPGITWLWMTNLLRWRR